MMETPEQPKARAPHPEVWLARLASLLPIYIKWFLILVVINSAAIKAVGGESAMIPNDRIAGYGMGAFLLSLCDFVIRVLWSDHQ